MNKLRNIDKDVDSENKKNKPPFPIGSNVPGAFSVVNHKGDQLTSVFQVTEPQRKKTDYT